MWRIKEKSRKKVSTKINVILCVDACDDIYCEKWGIFEIRANIKSYPTVVPLPRTHSVPPTHDLLLKLLHVSQVFLQQLANPHVIQAGWVWDEGETVDVCIHVSMFVFMDSPCREYSQGRVRLGW